MADAPEVHQVLDISCSMVHRLGVDKVADSMLGQIVDGTLSWNEAALQLYETGISDDVASRMASLLNSIDDDKERERLNDQFQFAFILAEKYGRLFQMLRDEGHDINVGWYGMPAFPNRTNGRDNE